MAVACKDAEKEVVIGDSRRLACLPDDKEVVTAGSHRVACLPESLVRVLSDPRILLAGIGVNGDVCRLEKEYEQLRACGVNGVVDLSLMANMKVRIAQFFCVSLCIVVSDGYRTIVDFDNHIPGTLVLLCYLLCYRLGLLRDGVLTVSVILFGC